MHLVSMQESESALQEEPSIKRTVSRTLFESLREGGRAACDAWLAEHRGQLGVAASLDMVARYLAPYSQPPVPH